MNMFHLVYVYIPKTFHGYGQQTDATKFSPIALPITLILCKHVFDALWQMRYDLIGNFDNIQIVKFIHRFNNIFKTVIFVQSLTTDRPHSIFGRAIKVVSPSPSIFSTGVPWLDNFFPCKKSSLTLHHPITASVVPNTFYMEGLLSCQCIPSHYKVQAYIIFVAQYE